MVAAATPDAGFRMMLRALVADSSLTIRTAALIHPAFAVLQIVALVAGRTATQAMDGAMLACAIRADAMVARALLQDALILDQHIAIVAFLAREATRDAAAHPLGTLSILADAFAHGACLGHWIQVEAFEAALALMPLQAPRPLRPEAVLTVAHVGSARPLVWRPQGVVALGANLASVMRTVSSSCSSPTHTETLVYSADRILRDNGELEQGNTIHISQMVAISTRVAIHSAVGGTC